MNAHPSTALDAWARWSCCVNGCTAHGESCDGDAALRAFRAHLVTRHVQPGNASAAVSAIGLAFSP